MISSIPISPPVTPKHSDEPHTPPYDTLELPPSLVCPSSPPTTTDLRRKSSVKRYSRAMSMSSSSSSSQDVITFRDPFSTEGHCYLTAPAAAANAASHHHSPSNRSKSIPTRSPSPSTRGSFTMDIFEDGVISGGGMMGRKRRNPEAAEQQERVTEIPVTQTHQPTFSALLNTERNVKKSKTDAAAAYDNVDITMSDETIFQDPEWIPDMEAFDAVPAVRVVWKGSPLSIDHLPHYELLHPGEVHIASTLRLTPEQYLKCRRSLILAAQEFDKLHIPFRKSDAQKCVRIDVNKTSTLWSVFSRLGWLTPSSRPSVST
ncbi:hypothetical protein V8B55DRAFT_1511628 [Mucor lusitanicus]|uniref:SWIRM domain-containing protein n=1 Tax=Mucor lusitanicus CBS 277.49 TaxID=747725 RepID=A0A168GTQ2_MUCCL|nr:hypothetical protein MUCCIDRAFT_157555 [Mucor lusitanicus CBS 277.49]